eukprot:3689736-Pleurochrysis_carterae.AAC.1
MCQTNPRQERSSARRACKKAELGCEESPNRVQGAEAPAYNAQAHAALFRPDDGQDRPRQLAGQLHVKVARNASEAGAHEAQAHDGQRRLPGGCFDCVGAHARVERRALALFGSDGSADALSAPPPSPPPLPPGITSSTEEAELKTVVLRCGEIDGAFRRDAEGLWELGERGEGGGYLKRALKAAERARAAGAGEFQRRSIVAAELKQARD